LSAGAAVAGRGQSELTDLTLPFLRALWPDPTGLLAAFTLPSKATLCADSAEGIAAAVLPHIENQNIYIRATSLKSVPDKGRAGAAASCAMPGIWADIDIKGPAHKAEDLPPDLDAALAIANCTAMAPSLIVHSGNGIQAWWVFREPVVFEDDGHIQAAAELVQRWQGILSTHAKKSGYRIDATHDLARVMRLPGTFNLKDRKKPKPVTFTDSGHRYNPSDFLEIVRPVPVLVPSVPTVKREFSPVSIAPIMEGCAWLRHCRDDANTLPEPEWYQMLTVVALCRDAEELAHGMSSPYPNYSHRETAEKLAHANSKGPVTCTYVETSLGFTGCASCQSRARVKSPISIASAPPDPWRGVDLAAITPPGRGGVPAVVPGKLVRITEADVPAARDAEENDDFGDEAWDALVKPGPDSGVALPPLELHDTGNADRLVAVHGSRLLYCEDRASFGVWAGDRWILDRGLLVSRLAEKVIRSAFGETGRITDSDKRKAFFRHLNLSLSRSGISNMVEVAKRKVRFVRPADFDANAYLLNFENGTLNLHSGLLLEHQPKHLITRCIPYAFDAAAECPLFNRFLYRIMGHTGGASDEADARALRMVAYLRRLFGCALTGKPEKIVAIFHGGGNNGKTTLLETIRAALGGDEYSGQLQIESLMVSQSQSLGSNAINADLAGLQGKRFVTASEPEKGMRFSSARLKHLTGLSVVKARFLRENPFTFPPSHKLFIDANDRPIVSDAKDALWNRLKLIPFTVEIPRSEIDTHLGDKLQRELPGIMAWMAAGAAEYIREGLVDIPEVLLATEDYRMASDTFGEFIRERCAVNPAKWVSVAALWEAYTEWAEGGGGVALPKREFDLGLHRIGCKKAKRDHGKVWAWDGIELMGFAVGDNG